VETNVIFAISGGDRITIRDQKVVVSGDEMMVSGM
jgi:hypothetical protein